MKIDFLINSLSGGGAERVITTIANGFSKKGYSVKLITFNHNEFYSTNPEINRIKLHHGKIKNHSVRSLINLFFFYLKSKNRPDVLVSFMPKTNSIAILVAKIFKIKVIISEHSNHKVNVPNQTKWIRKNLYKYADWTTVLTSFDINFYQSLGANVTVMPNPIILPNTISNFQSRDKNILIAGSLNRFEIKGFDILLKIIAPILKTNPEWKLIIAGSGDKGQKILQNISKKLRIENNVIFTGFCDNMTELMQCSQIYVLSSKYEGLPMVLMEALSNGMSCIAYDCISGPRDLIVNMENGLLIENQNQDKMREGINRLVTDNKLRISLAQNAPDTVRKYSLENILKQWEFIMSKSI